LLSVSFNAFDCQEEGIGLVIYYHYYQPKVLFWQTAVLGVTPEEKAAPGKQELRVFMCAKSLVVVKMLKMIKII